MLKTPTLLLALLAALFTPLRGQVTGSVPSPFASIEQNSVPIMEALGDTLWIGPGLNRNIANAEDWHYPEGADRITGGNGRVFSLALASDTVLAGLGYNRQGPQGSIQTALGYHYSTDGGDTWSYQDPYREQETDTLMIYGGRQYEIVPVTVSEQSPPFDLAISGGVILSANWASGVLRSGEPGGEWERLILPPLYADTLRPEDRYRFSSVDTVNRYDPRIDQNLLGFSVLADRSGQVWVGTAGGLNISHNALSAPRDSIRWRHLRVANSELSGNWIVTLRQQPATGDIWATTWNSGIHPNEQFGIVRTADGGATFDRYLTGEKINDIGFGGPATIFAAGDNGLFISRDDGATWEQVDQVRSANTFLKRSAVYYSVASTTGRVWVGSSDGLASTGDGGNSWEITRVDFPLQGGNRYQQDAPEVATYAYPNPYSPSRHDLVRIKFEVRRQGRTRIRLYDFGMNLIRTVDNRTLAPGTYEAVWDGRDRGGRRVANGPVIYVVETAGHTFNGKILVID